jgi:hypothetical protein
LRCRRRGRFWVTLKDAWGYTLSIGHRGRTCARIAVARASARSRSNRPNQAASAAQKVLNRSARHCWPRRCSFSPKARSNAALPGSRALTEATVRRTDHPCAALNSVSICFLPVSAGIISKRDWTVQSGHELCAPRGLVAMAKHDRGSLPFEVALAHTGHYFAAPVANSRKQHAPYHQAAK